jgi:hypothetical protein
VRQMEFFISQNLQLEIPELFNPMMKKLELQLVQIRYEIIMKGL